LFGRVASDPTVSHTVKALADAGPDDESGRGLIVVNAVTDAYGHYLTPTGKVVWFEIKADWPIEVAV
jgi:hypothetical protein